MKKTQSLRILACALVVAAACPASIYARQSLPNSVPSAAARLAPLGTVEPTRQLEFTIMLPLRNHDALNQLNADLYDPASPKFHQFLSLEEFTAQFGPTAEDYQAVLDFATKNGLSISATYPCHNVVALKGSVADIQRIFHTTLRTYQHPTENRTCFAPDTTLSIDLDVPILEVDGLNSFGTAQYHHTAQPLDNGVAVPNGNGSGPGHSYWGLDFQKIYIPGSTLTGAGQMVGLFQYDGYYLSDITNYANQSGLTNQFPYVPLQNILLDGVSGLPGYSGNSGAVGEVSLDIEMCIAMAPGLSKVVVFEGSAIPPIQILTAMTTNTSIKQFSSSWTWGGTGGIPNFGVDSLLQQLVSQGQCYFQASGDSCAYTSTIDDSGMVTIPATSTNVVAVGATTLTNDVSLNYLGETVWNWGGGVGSSGGISTYYNIPPWQQGFSITLNQGSTTKRNIPDVAMVGDQIYVIHDNGAVGSFGGTSCAAPLWAAYTALVNQKAVSAGRPTVGFINPAIYAIAKTANYTADFRDVTNGNNFNSISPSLFSAVAGLDLCTGLGSPNGTNLINALATPDTLGISPGTGFGATGVPGGPFSPNSTIFTLTNSSSSNLSWTVTLSAPWLSASLTNGTIPALGSTNVTVSLTSAANLLAGGNYSANAIFNNLTSGQGQARTFSLSVILPELVQNGDFELGNFGFWSLSGDWGPGYTTVTPATQIQTAAGTTDLSPHSGTWFAILATSGGGGIGFMQQDLTTVSNQFYVLSFWYSSSDGSTPNDFQAVWGGLQETNIVNGPIPWTNYRFIVQATNTVTTLLFAWQDDPSWLSVDDISVQPVPPLVILGSTNTASTFSFTWSTTPAANAHYQVQSSSSLSGGWSNVGSPTIATSNTLSYSESKSGQVKFYRVYLYP